MFHKMYKKSQILWWIRIERESWDKYKVKQNSDKARGSVIASEFCFFQPRYSIRCNCIKYILYYIVLHSITLYVIASYCTILLHQSFLPLNKKQADFPWEFATNAAESPFLTGFLCPLTWLNLSFKMLPDLCSHLICWTARSMERSMFFSYASSSTLYPCQ